MIGSMFFIGQVVTILIIPPLADFYLGRKPIFVGTCTVLVIVIAGFLFSNNIYEIYVFQFFNGCTFGGLIVVGINYTVEL